MGFRLGFADLQVVGEGLQVRVRRKDQRFKCNCKGNWGQSRALGQDLRGVGADLQGRVSCECFF